MTTRVRLPDGSYVNVPTTDPKAAAAAARRHWDKQKGAPAKSSWLDTAGDFFGDVVDNVIPNGGDELAGARDAAIAVVKGKSPGAAFRDGQKNFKANQQRYDKEHPNLAWGSTIGGNVAGLLVPGGAALRGASLGQKALQAAKVGGAYGVASGALQGDTIGDRATNALVSGGFGATVGGSLPFVGNAAVSGGRWARRNIPGVDAAVSTLSSVPRAVIRATTGRGPQPTRAPSAARQDAERMVNRQMNDGEISRGFGVPGHQANPRNIASEVAMRNQRGVPAMVGDVTPAMRNLTAYSSRGLGPGQTMVRSRLDARKAQEAARVRQYVQNDFPTTNDPVQYVEEAFQRARAQAKPLYDAAYSQPMQINRDIQGLMQTPAFQEALPQAYRNIRNQIDPNTGMPMDPTAMGMRFYPGPIPQDQLGGRAFLMPDGSGHVRIENGLSTEGFDQVARAMGDSGRAASNINPVTGRLESTTNSVHINQRTADLRRQMGDQNPDYKAAIEGYGDDMTQINAFQQGQDFGKLTGPEIAAQGRALPEPAHQTWTTGAGTEMANEASRYGAKYPTGATANHVRQMLGDDAKQAAVSEMQGSTGGVRNLLDNLEYENQANINWQGVNGNSRTAHNQALDADVNAQVGIPVSGAGIRDRMVNFITSRAAPQFQQELKERIAQIVTASDAQSVQEVLQALEAQASRDRDFAQLLQRGVVGTANLYGRNLQADSPEQEEQ